MPELHPYDVIRRPVITEKSNLMAMESNQYVFEVALKANKIQIKEAIGLIFERDVALVRTMIMPAKRGRRGRNWYIRARSWKKAIISLEPGQTIDLFNV
ncbi:50S ribosomal protein L23 [Anaerolineales bacterium]|jgi:large subunit ribosomal protein L23